MTNNNLNKERLFSVEPQCGEVAEYQTSPHREVVIYDREASQLDEVRQLIKLVRSPLVIAPHSTEATIQQVPPAPKALEDSQSWSREFLLRKNKRLL